MASPSSHNAAAKLFSLADPLSSKWFRGDVDTVDTYRSMKRAVRGEGSLPTTPLIQHSMGRILSDFLWISLIPVIHERVRHLLSTGGVTGWSTYPVLVQDRDGEVLSSYCGLSIVGRCESIFFDRKPAAVVYRDLPGGRFPYYKGLTVTTDSWDGSDMFTSRDGRTTFIVVTEKVKTLLTKAGVKNVSFQPISEVEIAAEDLPRQ